MGKLTHAIWHCTATPKGREISADRIKQWHMGPRKLDNGMWRYKGRNYKTLLDLPHEKIGGKFVADLRGNGWDRPGYREVILLDGTREILHEVNDDSWIESHEMTWGALGVNSNAIHYCYVGGLEEKPTVHKNGRMTYKAEDTRTKEQMATMIQITMEQVALHPDIKWSGHNQHNRKACPSFDVIEFCEKIGLKKKNIYLQKLS